MASKSCGKCLIRGLVAVAVAFLVVASAWADPGAVIWSGAAVRLMEEHPTVQLLWEKILIEPDVADARITVLLEFENRGEATTAAMGFPTVPEGEGGYYFIRGFNVEVDDKPVEVKTEEGPVQMPKGVGHRRDDRGVQGRWYLFNVPFEARGHRRMRIRYRQSCSEDAYDRWVGIIPYILFTGGTWNGPIKSVELEVRLVDRRNFNHIALRGERSDAPGEWPVLKSELRGSTLLWKAENYQDSPAILWFTAGRGPALLQIDDEQATGGYDAVRWHHGQLLVEVEFLADLLCAEVKPHTAIQYSASVEKEGKTADLEGVYLRAVGGHRGQERRDRLLVDPEPALRAFDGGLRLETDRNGDAVVRFVRFQQGGVKTAAATALAEQQKIEYRLRCLNIIAQRWPDQVADLCRKLCTRPKEKAEVLLWAMGACAEARADYAAPDSILTRLDLPREGRVEGMAEMVLATNDDHIVRGGALLLCQLDAAAARDYLIGHISKCADWMSRPGRGRNAGLALRIMQTPEARQRLIDAIGGANGQELDKNVLYALGFLGDEGAIPILVQVALDPNNKNNNVAGAAAEALGHLRTRGALAACAEVIERSNEPGVLWGAREGFEIATGYHRPPGGPSWMPRPPPGWAVSLSELATCRAALPLLERIARTPKEHADLTRCLAYVRQKLAQAGGANP